MDSVLTQLDEDGVLTITLNRPATRNALTGDMSRAISDSFASADNDDSIRAVVVTGAGDAFCAGADFSRGAEVFDRPRDSHFTACPISPPPSQTSHPVYKRQV